MCEHLQSTVAIDSTCIVAFVEQRFYNQFFIAQKRTFVIQADEFGGFTRKHATVDKCKFSHDEISVGVVTCTGQWNQTTVLCAKC